MRDHPRITAGMLALAWLVFTGGVFRDALHESTTEGRRLYDAGKYAEALAAYGRGRAEEPDNPVLAFNVGDTLLAMGKADEALAEYRKALSSEDPKLKARTQYNIGNAYLRKEDLRRAIDAYRQSLLQDAAQKDAKRNLELALKKLKEQQEKEKQSKDQSKKDQQNQDQQKQGQSGDSKQSKDQQGKDQQNQQAKHSRDQKGQQQQSQEQQQGQKQDARQAQAKPQPGQKDKAARMDKAQAMQLLQALGNQEKAELLQLMQQQRKTSRKEGRDW
jgi:hypothetical protein